MEGKGVRSSAMDPNATDSPVDGSPEVDATGHEATSPKGPVLVLDREGASDRSSDTGPEDPSPEGRPEGSGPEGLARARTEGNPRPRLRHHPEREEPSGRRGAGTGARPHPQESPRTNPKGNQGVRGTPAQERTSRAEARPDLLERAGETGPGDEGTPAWGARGTRARPVPGPQGSATSGAGSQPR